MTCIGSARAPYPTRPEAGGGRGTGVPIIENGLKGRESDPGNHVEVTSTNKKLPEPFLNITFLKESQLLLNYAIVQLQ